MQRAADALVCAALAMALAMPTSAADAQAGRMDSAIDWGFYDGRILYIAVTQTARNGGDAPYSDVDTVLDDDGNVLPLLFTGLGHAFGRTTHTHHYAEMPEGATPGALHVSVMTGIALPESDELLEPRLLTIDLPLADADIRTEYSIDAEDAAYGGLTRADHYFRPNELNLFRIERTLTPAQATDFGEFVLSRDDEEILFYGGNCEMGIGITQTVQMLFFEPCETPPHTLVMRFMNGAGTGQTEITLQLVQ